MIPWLQTHTGKKVFPFKLTLDDIDLVDIAYSLSHQARYLGHTKFHYSIAQHCILSARALFEYEGVEGVETHLQMLFHDASEAYLSDIIGPLKHLIYIEDEPGKLIKYQEMEDRVSELIFTKFNIRYPFDPIVKTVDHRILFSEKRDIHVPSPEPWNYPAEPYPIEVHEWNPRFTATCFINMANNLFAQRASAATPPGSR